MRTRYYRLVLLFALLFSANAAYCQSVQKTWAVYYQDDNLVIEVSPAQRNDSANGIFNNYYLFRVTNTTAQQRSVSFHKNLEYNLMAFPSDKASEFILGPHESIEGSELPQSDKGLRIFVNQPDGKNKNVLTHFSLSGIQSTEIKEK